MQRWLWLCLLLPMVAEGAFVQYRVADLQVIGAFTASEDARLTPDTALLSVPGATAADIVWPVPSGCASGRKEWTQVTAPGVQPLVVNPTLIFFSSSSPLLPTCAPVTSKRQTRQVVDQAILRALQLEDMILALSPMNAWFLALCITVDGQDDLTWSTNANCLSWKTSLDSVNTRYPSRAQGSTLAGQMATLLSDQDTFLTAQCALVPGGPFC